MNQYSYKISIVIDALYEEIVSSILWDNGTNGVAIEDSNTLIDSINDKSNWDYIDDALLASAKVLTDSNKITVIGFFDNDISQVLHKALAEFGDIQGIDHRWFDITADKQDNDEWLSNHKKYFVPIEFDRVVISPEWIDTDSSKEIVRLYHAAAFGTGQHESTAMCITLLERQRLAGQAIIDVGCGSGILGIVASKLGGNVTFVDNDASAIKATMDNCRLNNILKPSIIEGSLLDNIQQRFDIIVANLTAELLIKLSYNILAHMTAGAKVVASGIINSRAAEVESCFVNIGLAIDTKITKGEWTAFVFGV